MLFYIDVYHICLYFPNDNVIINLLVAFLYNNLRKYRELLMNDISVTETYFVYSIQNKGKLSGNDSRKVTGLITAALWEMSQHDLITISETRIIPQQADAFPHSWMQPLYEHIKEIDSPDLASLLSDYSSSWSDRHLNALTNEIGIVLEKKGLVTRAKLGLFNGRTYFMPHQSTVPGLDAVLQVDMLYQNPISADTAFLWMLLEEGHCISKNISQDMQQTFSVKVKEALAGGADPTLTSAKALLNLSFSLMKKHHMIMD